MKELFESSYLSVMGEENDKLRKEIERLKEEYVMLQNASDEVEEEKDKEIEKLTAESTKWESKFYDEAKKVDRAIEYIKAVGVIPKNIDIFVLLDILKGDDKE